MTDSSGALVGRGVCHGFEIHSALPFATLRHGGGEALTVVEQEHLEPTGETLITWPERPDHPFHGRLLRDGDTYGFWASDCGWFLIDPGLPKITVQAGGDRLRRELRLLGVPTSMCVFERGDISIHAAAVEIDGRAVLLAGPSRFGKTTLAAAIARAGHRLLSEDTTRCTTRPVAAAYPGPAAVRLRTDVADRVAPPGERLADGQDGQDERLRIILDPASRGDGAAVPLAAILLLRSIADQPELTTVPAASAIRDVYALTLRLPTPESEGACFERVADLVTGLPVFDLHRPLTMEALPRVIELIEGLARA